MITEDLDRFVAEGDEFELVSRANVTEAFSEEDHPRGDDGRFISKGDIELAKTDDAKAAELFAKTTDPAERAKLEKETGRKAPSRINSKVHDWARKKFGDEQKAKAFAEWFGDSKVVDENGEPMVVYHGTLSSEGFDKFSSPVVWFSSDPESAAKYSMTDVDGVDAYKTGSRVMPVYASLKDPVPARHQMHAMELASQKDNLIAEGYDGISFNAGNVTVGVAFNPNQIKSATGNRGTFDPKSANINEAFDESDHPRGDDGRFISKGDIELAKTDDSKAAELFAKTTDPAERTKLEKETGRKAPPRVNPKVHDWARKKFGDEQKAKAFAEWFGDSKVVDENGEPLVVYHGTAAEFDEFGNTGGRTKYDAGYSGRGFYFGSSDTAATYAGAGRFAKEPTIGGRVIPVHLSMQNPIIIQEVNGGDDQIISVAKAVGIRLPPEVNGINAKRLVPSISDDITSAMMKRGHDGVIYKWHGGREVEYMVPRSSQIKSATGNRGTFDPKSANINEAFDESDHPRGDDGRFISKGDIELAKTDDSKAAELFAKTTDPAERTKLEKETGRKAPPRTWNMSTDSIPPHDSWKDLPENPDYYYHATNTDNAAEISAGSLEPHKPWHGTEQEVWPDGSTASRSYFTPSPSIAWQFAPTEGKPALLRVRRNQQFKSESTGDIYLERKRVPPTSLEILTDTGWKKLASQQ